MKYRGEIDQITIFGQLEFIPTENYTNKGNKEDKDYIFVSGKYRVVGTEEEIEATLNFFGRELSKHAFF